MATSGRSHSSIANDDPANAIPVCTWSSCVVDRRRGGEDGVRKGRDTRIDASEIRFSLPRLRRLHQGSTDPCGEPRPASDIEVHYNSSDRWVNIAVTTAMEDIEANTSSQCSRIPYRATTRRNSSHALAPTTCPLTCPFAFFAPLTCFVAVAATGGALSTAKASVTTPTMHDPPTV